MNNITINETHRTSSTESFIQEEGSKPKIKRVFSFKDDVTSFDKLKEDFEATKSITSPNFIPFSQLTSLDGKPALIRDFVPGKSLIRSGDSPLLQKENILKLCLDLALTIQKFHSNDIVIGNIHPRNILISDQNLAFFVDFGIKQFFDDLFQSTQTPTVVLFSGPEGVAGQNCFTKERDIWAFGVLLYFILFGYNPWRTSNLMRMYHDVANTEILFDLDFDSTLKKLLTEMLDKDPLKRPPINYICETLTSLNSEGAAVVLPERSIKCKNHVEILVPVAVKRERTIKRHIARSSEPSAIPPPLVLESPLEPANQEI